MKTHKIIFNDNESIEFEATKEFLEGYPSGGCEYLDCEDCPLCNFSHEGIYSCLEKTTRNVLSSFKNTTLEELDALPDEPIVEGKLVYYNYITNKIYT